MPNPFDQFDENAGPVPVEPQSGEQNPFNQFDEPAQPAMPEYTPEEIQAEIQRRLTEKRQAEVSGATIDLPFQKVASLATDTPPSLPGEEPEEREIYQDADAMSDYILATVKNAPGSAKGVIKELYEAVKHPVKTVKGVAALGAGAAEMVIPGE